MTPRFLLTAAAVLAAFAARAADPVVVDLPARAAAKGYLVRVGDVARLTGGADATRARVAELDLAELNPRDPVAGVTRRQVEFRLRLAGFAPADVIVMGADATGVVAETRLVTSDEVVAAVRAELARRLPNAVSRAPIQLAYPIAARLPAVPVAEAVSITARPHALPTGPGRVQMDASIAVGGEKLLAFPVIMAVGQPPAPAAGPAALPLSVAPAAGPADGTVIPAAATAPASVPSQVPAPTPSEVVVRARDKVTLAVRAGALWVTAAGEALQDGRIGQVVSVRNVDSKKTVTGKVTGPGTVEVELGGTP